VLGRRVRAGQGRPLRRHDTMASLIRTAIGPKANRDADQDFGRATAALASLARPIGAGFLLSGARMFGVQFAFR
jgi:hypothetical protein